jgi:hypothetical protein
MSEPRKEIVSIPGLGLSIIFAVILHSFVNTSVTALGDGSYRIDHFGPGNTAHCVPGRTPICRLIDESVEANRDE